MLDTFWLMDAHKDHKNITKTMNALTTKGINHKYSN